MANNESEFVIEGVINGIGFREVVALPNDSGGGNKGGGEGAIKNPTVIVIPVVVVTRERPAPKPKR